MIKCASLFSQILNEISSSRIAVLTEEIGNDRNWAGKRRKRFGCSGKFLDIIDFRYRHRLATVVTAGLPTAAALSRLLGAKGYPARQVLTQRRRLSRHNL